jgi:hypothetical protein
MEEPLGEGGERLHDWLVDELHLMIGSAVLGEGIPVFAGPRTDLRLLDARVLDGSQLILASTRRPADRARPGSCPQLRRGRTPPSAGAGEID